MIVNLFIKGVAYCFEKDDKWRVLLPFDDLRGHRSRLSWKDRNGNPQSVELAGAGGKVSVETLNASSSHAKDFDKVIDLTSADLHSSGVDLQTDWADHCVELTIENARMKKFEHQYENEFYLLCDRPEKPPQEDESLEIRKPPEKYTRYLRARIEIDKPANGGGASPEKDAGVFIKTNKTGYEEIFFEYSEGAEHNVEIDNDCDGRGYTDSFENDFQLYYNILRDKTASENDRFALVWIPANLSGQFPGGKITKKKVYGFPKPEPLVPIVTTRLFPCHVVEGDPPGNY